MNDDQKNYWQPPEESQETPLVPPQMAPPTVPVVPLNPAFTQTQPEADNLDSSLAPNTDQDIEQDIEQGVGQALDQNEDQAAPTTLPNQPVTWSAQEYVHLDKGPVWFIVLVLIALALIATDVFFLQSWTFSLLVVVMFVALIVYIRRPPRTLTYAISPAQGLYVGERLYPFDEFKAFGVIEQEGHHSILLIPRKRFGMGVSVFFPEEAGEQIVDLLGQQLPMESLKLDVVDKIVHSLRL